MPYNTPIDSKPLYVNEVNKLEHEDSDLPKAKRVLMYGWDSDTLSKQRIAVSDHAGYPALIVHTPDMTLTDAITGLNDTAELDIHGMGSCVVQVSGTWTGKIEFQGAIDGVWNTLSIFQPTGAITRNGIQNDNQNGLYRIVITSGYTKVRAILTAWSAGTANILFNASTPVGSSQVWQLNASNLNATVTPATTFPIDNRFNTNHIDDTTTTNVVYIGMEDSSGVAMIKKIDSSGSFPVFTYATVTNNPTLTTYTLLWNARTTATYNLYSVAF